MANITLLHWNIETYGPTKFANGNNANFISYIANLVNNVNADIFSMVEVKNSISAALPGLIAADVDALQGIPPAPSPWRSVRMNSGNNSEAYIVMYRTDRNFLPIKLASPANQVGANVVPENGLGFEDDAGNRIPFPAPMTRSGGRRPFYVAFQTTDTNNIFTVISYHAMFGAYTPLGIRKLPSLDVVTEFYDTDTDVDGSLISGDFNVDFIQYPGDYTNVLALPSVQATNEKTSMKNNPPVSDDPDDYRESAYDNIFQKIPPGGATNPGLVTDLMVESAIVTAPQPPPPAAQPHVGNLSAAAGAFNVGQIPNNWAANPVAAVPPTDMPTAWAFVREAISNHYPVSVTTTI